MKRVVIAGFQHETNTFGATLAGYAEFKMADAWPPLLQGGDVIAGTRGINLPMTGFVDSAKAAGGIDLIPVVWCSAEPSSYVTDDAFERIGTMIVDGIADAGAIDAVYLDLHGAMVTQSHEDGEGELLRRIRARIGDDVPIVVSLDLHANLTREIAGSATALTIYRTYPHLDMAETGARAFSILARIIDGQAVACAYRQMPFLVPLQAQYTKAEPCRSLYAMLGSEALADALSADIAMGFPAADIADAGPALIAYGADRASAERSADTLEAAFLAAEKAFDAGMLSAAEAVAEAKAIAAGGAARPVVIADAQDNPGAGAPSDSTGLLAALVEGGARHAVLGLLDDAESAAAAHAAGLGAELTLGLGGKSGLPGQAPYEARYVVEALGDGSFDFTGEMYRGAHANLGPCALLRVVDDTADVRVAVGSHRCQCLDLAIFRHLGVEPAEQAIIGVKSSVHFRADFEPIAETVIVAEAPGANPCRLDIVNYRNVRSGVRLMPLGPVQP